MRFHQRCRAPLQARIRALVCAADHQRLEAVDRLLEAGTPVDAVPAGVRRLPAHRADPKLRDEQGRRPLDPCSPANRYLDHSGHREVEAILRPLTAP